MEGASGVWGVVGLLLLPFGSQTTIMRVWDSLPVDVGPCQESPLSLILFILFEERKEPSGRWLWWPSIMCLHFVEDGLDAVRFIRELPTACTGMICSQL